MSVAGEKEVINKALTLSLKLISLRPRTEKEIEEKLANKNFSTDIISQIIDKLKKDKLLDDLEFAKWWIEQRSEFRPKGKIILKQELLQKGVDKENIENALSDVSNEYEAAKKLADKHFKKFGELNNRENFQKAAQFLQRRGFSWSSIKKALREEQ